MAKVPYIPLYIGDWEQDTNCLSLSAEAAWLKIIFKMFKDNKSGIYKTSTKSLQNLWKTDTNGIQNILSEFSENNICDLEIADIIIFKNRRMLRDIEIGKIRRKSVQTRYKTSTNDLQNTEYENEYDTESETVLKGVQGENKVELQKDGFFLNDLPKDMQLSEMEVGKTIQFVKLTVKQDVTESQVAEYWEAFKIQWFEKKEWKNSIEDLMSHFRNSFKQQKFNQHESAKRSTGNRNSPDLSLLGDNREPL